MGATLLPARPGGFKRTPRIVQPHIAAADHLARDMDVIILHDHQVPLQLAELAEVHDALDIALAVVVVRLMTFEFAPLSSKITVSKS